MRSQQLTELDDPGSPSQPFKAAQSTNAKRQTNKIHSDPHVIKNNYF
jgi:hypothetical protein